MPKKIIHNSTQLKKVFEQKKLKSELVDAFVKVIEKLNAYAARQKAELKNAKAKIDELHGRLSQCSASSALAKNIRQELKTKKEHHNNLERELKTIEKQITQTENHHQSHEKTAEELISELESLERDEEDEEEEEANEQRKNLLSTQHFMPKYQDDDEDQVIIGENERTMTLRSRKRL